MGKKIIVILISLLAAALLLYSIVDVCIERFAPPFSTEEESLNPQAIILNFDLRYYLRQLDEGQINAVCVLYECMMDFQKVCTLPRGLDAEEADDLIQLLQVECPELFQVDFQKGLTYYYYSGSKEVYRVEIAYRLHEDEYAAMRVACEEAVKQLASQIQNQTELQKETFIFDHLALNCQYDSEADHSDTAYGALVEGRAECDGISLAMKWCFEAANMDCICIFANPHEGQIGHAWNMVCVDGSYWNVDLTASVRYPGMDAFTRERVIYYLFNVSDTWFRDDYEILSCYDAFAQRPLCLTNQFSYYAEHGQYVSKVENEKELIFESLDAACMDGEYWLQFDSEQAYRVFCEAFHDYAQSWLDSQISDRYTVSWYELSNHLFCVMVKKLG